MGNFVGVMLSGEERDVAIGYSESPVMSTKKHWFCMRLQNKVTSLGGRVWFCIGLGSYSALWTCLVLHWFGVFFSFVHEQRNPMPKRQEPL